MSPKETPALLPPIRFTERFEEAWQNGLVEGVGVPTPAQKRISSALWGLTLLNPLIIGASVFSILGGPSSIGAIFPAVLYGVFTFFLCGLLSSEHDRRVVIANQQPVPTDAMRQFQETHAAQIERLKKDVAAFESGIPYLDVLQGTTERYEECRRRCKERHARLSAEAEELLVELRHANATTAAYARLEELKRRLPDLIDGTDTGRFTQDVTPYVALLDANETLDRRTYGLPEDGSLPKDLVSTEDTPPPDRYRIERE